MSMKHGRRYAYGKGCRCEPCVHAERTYQREFYAKNRERIQQQELLRRLANPEREKAKQARYRRRHPDRVKAKLKKWRESEKGQRWVEGYRDTSRAKFKVWQAANYDRYLMTHRLSEMYRRARKAKAAGTATSKQVHARIAYYGGKCWMCRKAEWEHVDHVIPLAAGGSAWPSNLRPACAACNMAKGARPVKIG